VFFFVAAFIYVDIAAPDDIRHSAQSLITFVTYGIGLYLGSLFAGWIQNYFTADSVTNWTGVFLVPCLLTILCAFAFILFFKDERAKTKSA
jgi:MFS family permease